MLETNKRSSNMTKVQSYVILVLSNVTMKLLNARKKLKYY